MIRATFEEAHPPGWIKEHIIDAMNELVLVRQVIPWQRIIERLISFYDPHRGRWGASLRILVALLIVAKLRQLSDREVIQLVKENRYGQYFCNVPDAGLLSFLDSSTLSKFRTRLGEKGIASLNSTLTGKLPGRTFVCFTMGEIDLSTHSFHLANGGGCPSPYHYRAPTGEVIELETAAYPLGVRADTRYSTLETQLEPGDYVVFCSDGITEMSDPSGEIFGFERTAETIHQACAEDLSADAIVERLIGIVKDFAGDAPQGDDMTVVVLKVEA